MTFFQMQLNSNIWIQTSLCWEMESGAPSGNNYSSSRHIWYVYSHSYHFYSSSQMNRFNSKQQHNLWGLLQRFSKVKTTALKFRHWVHERDCVRRRSHPTQSQPPSKSILIHVSIKTEHWKTKAGEMFWKACEGYREMCKVKWELQAK